jgi:hypothetical protein
MNSLVRHSLCILGGVVVLICAYVVGAAIHARSQASTLFKEFRSLDTAANPSAGALALIEKHSDQLAHKICRSDLCQYEFLFTNGTISRFHVLPRAEITVYVTLNRGSLENVIVTYTSAVFKADSPIVWVQEDFCAISDPTHCDYFYLNPHGRDVPQTWNGDIGLGQMATQEQKRAAWAFNPDCFTALRGCKDITELLPGIWKLTSPRAVSSRMRSMADSTADASQPLPE